MKLHRKKGFTLVEVMVGLLMMVTLFGSMVTAYLVVKSLNTMARHKMQAIQMVRGRIEELKASTYSTIANSTTTRAYDSGSDGVYGTADDANGTLTVVIQDAVDFDNDGNTGETAINVDSSGGNDSVAVPVRVTMSWNEWVLGQSRNMSVSADTIIAQ